MNIIMLGERQVALFAPNYNMKRPIVYTHLSIETAEAVYSLLENENIVLAAVDGVDWDAELSPWPAPRAFRRGNDFTGHADTYLQELGNDIIPAVEATLDFQPDCRYLAGYSLAGLFSVYALYRTDMFSRAASVSGSLWYDGFVNFMKENHPYKRPEQVYFSLGEQEGFTKNIRSSKVKQCTLDSERILQDLGAKTIFEINRGNHFADIPERIAKGIRWILS